jgi:hypothetical protein
MMTELEFFEKTLDQIRPSPTERKQVQARIDQTVEHIHAWNPVAELHPCGSWAKRTMLAGRKEADLVMIMATAPDDRTLGELAAHLASLPGRARRPEVKNKAVALEFNDGVKLDLLPVAKDGRTPEGPSIPRKLRHALSGIEHVQWFKRETAGTPLAQVVMLLKYIKQLHAPAFDALPSFALEVIAVGLCREPIDDINDQVFHTLEDIAVGFLNPGQELAFLHDPAVPSRNLLADLNREDLEAIQHKAGQLARHIYDGEWYALFPRDGYLPSSDSNIGGRTLA